MEGRQKISLFCSCVTFTLVVCWTIAYTRQELLYLDRKYCIICLYKMNHRNTMYRNVRTIRGHIRKAYVSFPL